MVQLETVEDFENIKKALSNPVSQPRQYCICPYSYCWRCDEVKEFEAPIWRSDSDCISVICSNGHGYFLDQKVSINNLLWGTQAINEKLQQEFVNEMNRLNSREMQVKFFAVELERRITAEKKKMREVKISIEGYARLRT